MERSCAKQGSNYIFYIFILMVLCTCFRCGIMTPLGVCPNLFFAFVTIVNLSGRWLEIIWPRLYQSANGIDTVASHVPRSKELSFNNSADSENWFVACRTFVTIDVLMQLNVIKTLQFFSWSLKSLFRCYRGYRLRKEL